MLKEKKKSTPQLQQVFTIFMTCSPILSKSRRKDKENTLSNNHFSDDDDDSRQLVLTA